MQTVLEIDQMFECIVLPQVLKRFCKSYINPVRFFITAASLVLSLALVYALVLQFVEHGGGDGDANSGTIISWNNDS